MGVKRAGVLLKNTKLTKLIFDGNSTYIVDVSSCFYMQIRKLDPVIFWKWVKKLFPPSIMPNIVFVLDGIHGSQHKSKNH